MNAEHININNLVEETCRIRLDSHRIIIDAKEVDLIFTDQMILSRIISNLIDNALKYSPAESEVKIFIRSKDIYFKPGVQLRVVNMPDQAGMPDLEKIFTKYYRSQGAHAKTGSGLGLYLVKSFVDLIDAKIECVIANNEITFDLWIPN